VLTLWSYRGGLNRRSDIAKKRPDGPASSGAIGPSGYNLGGGQSYTDSRWRDPRNGEVCVTHVNGHRQRGRLGPKNAYLQPTLNECDLRRHAGAQMVG